MRTVKLTVDFQAMSEAEAETFLQYLLEGVPIRMRWPREEAARAGGPQMLDGTGDSLLPLWTWARRRFAWRTPDQPIDEIDLPAWYHDPSGIGFDRFSDDTLWLIDAIGRYWATVLQAAGAPHVQWEVCRSRIKYYADQNQPVLTGFRVAPNPVGITGSATSRSLTGSSHDGRLAELHATWVGTLTGK